MNGYTPTPDAKTHRATWPLVFSLFLFFSAVVYWADPLEQAALAKYTRLVSFVLALLVLLATMSYRELQRTVQAIALPAPFLVMMTWIALSTVWSVDRDASIVRLIETVFCFAYSSLFVHLALVRLGSSQALISCIRLAIFLVIIYGLVVNAVVFGDPFHLYVSKWVPERPRLRLGFLHFLAAADIILFGLITALYVRNRFDWINLTIFPLAVFTLLLTDSTAARLALLIMIGKSLFDHAQGSLRYWIVISGAFAVCVLSAALLAGLVKVSLDPRLLSLTGRVDLWAAIIDSDLVTSPIGVGYDASHGPIKEVFGQPYHAHNMYLSIVVELGYIGLAIYCALVVAWAIAVSRVTSGYYAALMIYVLLIGMNNPGMLSKSHIIFMFAVSFFGSIHIARQERASATMPRPETYTGAPHRA